MTGNDSIFTSLEDPGDHEYVTYFDNSRGKVLGLGRIAISKYLSISNVLFVEALSFNLISIAQLCDFGLTTRAISVGHLASSRKRVSKKLYFSKYSMDNVLVMDMEIAEEPSE